MREHMSRRTVTIHLAALVGWLSGSAAFFRMAAPCDAPATVYDTVHRGSFTVIGVLLYSLAYQALRGCTPKAWGLRRPHMDAERYSELSERDRLVFHAGLPKLTIGNVWSLVYGLGLVFFVITYCVTARQLLCYYFLTLGLAALCVDEALDLYPDMRAFLSYAGVVGLSSLSVLCSMLDQGVKIDDTSLFSLVWGMLLPSTAPMLFFAVKSHRHYSLGGTIELCEFGVPFASIVGLLYVSVMDYPAVHDLSARAEALNVTLDQTSGDLLLTGLVSPWLVVPCVVFVTGAILQGRSVDPLLAIATVTSGLHFADHMDSNLAVAALMLAGKGLLLRLWTTEDKIPPPVTVEEEMDADIM